MDSERSAPNSIPRKKTYTYLFLIGITSVLIYFYSYPLNMENWTIIKEKVIGNVDFSRKDEANIPDVQALTTDAKSTMATISAVFLRTLLFKYNVSDVENKQSIVTNVTKIETTTSIPNDLQSLTTKLSFIKSLNYTENNSSTVPETELNNSMDLFMKASSPKPVEQKNIPGNVSVMNSKQSVAQSTGTSTFEMAKGKNTNIATTAVDEIRKTNQSLNDSTKAERNMNDAQHLATTLEKMTIKDTKNQTVTTNSKTADTSEIKNLQDTSTGVISFESNTPSVEKGYLVFSENCRIPDIDPWHQSILRYVEKTPPLDCSEHYKPLTTTNGNVLILDEAATLKRTAGNKYICCYSPLFRINDGKTDQGVGYSKCVNMSRETTIKDEFVHVKCEYENRTVFYQEFHSFIFDKPKVEERCSNASKSLYSVLIVGVDSVSRLNMHRQLNATANYLLKEMEAIEMYGYNKVGDNTFPNLVPLLTGYDERDLPKVCWKSQDLPLDNCNILWKSFAEKGYRTFYAEDSPHISTFNYVKKGFYYQPTDYYFRPFIKAYEDALGRDKPLNCYQCVGSTSETEAVLNWAEQFAAHFSNQPYFAFSWINSLTHDFLNRGSAGDHMYERFFHNLHRAGALNKTIVILISDHGMRWGEIRNTYVGRLEERLPMLLIALPQMFKQDYPYFSKVLRENSHRLITPFDLHATLRHLLNLTNNWIFQNTDNVDEDLSYNFTMRAQSLFQPMPEDRSCDDAYIEEHWCTCETSLNVDVKNEKVKQVAMFLLEHINKLLEPVSDICAQLKLESIIDARLWQPPSEHAGHSVNDDIYTVVIQTNPNKAVFEGTVRLSKPKIKYKLLGTISRLNLYGNQSLCIDNAILKKYCYCL